jgi:hypothetical protein
MAFKGGTASDHLKAHRVRKAKIPRKTKKISQGANNFLDGGNRSGQKRRPHQRRGSFWQKIISNFWPRSFALRYGSQPAANRSGKRPRTPIERSFPKINLNPQSVLLQE